MIMFIKQSTIEQKKQKGFTLIEMLVAVSIFVIVAFIVTTVFISAMAAYRKSQDIKRVMENLNFALDSMALDIREGKEHVKDSNGSLTVKFKDAGNNTVTNIYSLVVDNNKGRVKKTISGSGQESYLTSEEVDINKLSFSVFGENNERKLIRILIEGKAGDVVKGYNSFSIQTTLFQRNSDDD